MLKYVCYLKEKFILNDIKVSIYCITYNHVGLISKAIEGFLMQKTNFNFEILIHDDNSSDGTVDILKQYEKKYPNLIKVIYERENQYSKGVPIFDIMKPFLTGKYIAMCEGDDYWIDPYKLQKQVNFMDNHDDVMLCIHAAKEISLKTNFSLKRPQNIRNSQYVSMNSIIIAGGGFFPTCSFLRRNNYEFITNRWGKGICGDFNNILHAGLNGKVYYIDEVMAVKTVFYPGSWSSIHSDTNLMKRHMLNEIESLKKFNRDTDYKYKDSIEKRILLVKLLIECEIEKNYKKYFLKKNRVFLKDMTIKKIIRAFLLAYAYPLYKIIIKIRYKLKSIIISLEKDKNNE